MSKAIGVKGWRVRGWAVLACLLPLAVACGDEGPASGPGTLTVQVVSPNGAEGAALVRLIGPGLGQVAPDAGRVFSDIHGDTLNVVVVNEAGGDLRFGLAVADTTRPPQGVLVDVSGPDDAVRPLAGYAVEVRR